MNNVQIFHVNLRQFFIIASMLPVSFYMSGIPAAEPELSGQVVFQLGTKGSRFSVNKSGELDESNQNKNPSDVPQLKLKDDQNVLIVDGTANKAIMPAITTPRTFVTIDDFAQFAKAKLGATIDQTGPESFRIQGKSIVVGTPYWVDTHSHHVYKVTDPIKHFLVGETGFLTIAGHRYELGKPIECIDCDTPAREIQNSPGEHGQTESSPPNTSDPCSGKNCIAGNSFINNFLGIYYNVGAQTTQVSGGFETSTNFCLLNGWIPWLCTTSSGTNELFVSATIALKKAGSQGGPDKILPQISARNVPNIQVSEWAICYPGSCGELASASAVCGQHAGVGINWSIGTFNSFTGTGPC